MRIPHAFVSLLAVLACPFLGQAQTAPSSKPNIIYILADDLGFAELGCNGGDAYKTPNIDALAAGGVRFTHFYTAPLCGPSRSLILTGRYAFRTGATNQDACANLVRTGAKAEVMIPTLLKKAGYATAMIGKWGQLSPSGSPAEWGFDYDLHFKGSGIYWNSTVVKGMTPDGAVRGNPDPYTLNGKTLKLGDKQYMPDLLHRHVVDFLEANQKQPFFLYYSMSHVHGEILPTPDSVPGKAGAKGEERAAELYRDNVVYMDKLIGKLLTELDRLKLRDNTLIVFMGDNGTAKAQSDRATIGGKRLEGEKGSMKEGGGLVPFFINWRGVASVGKVNSNVADASDLLPTFAEVAGVPVPADRVMDGKSLVPYMKGETTVLRPWVYNQLGPNWYVREAGWKLNQAGELYDMKNAPFSETLVPAESKDPAAVAARTRLAAALAQLNPAGGILDKGDGSGRSSNKEDKKKKKATKADGK
ncbi:MAG: sulfatase-like hydrolase/transferase [Verrucomicrobiota bacterium]